MVSMALRSEDSGGNSKKSTRPGLLRRNFAGNAGELIRESREQNPFSSIATENESGAPEKSTGIVATQVKRLFRIICQLSFSCRFIRRIIFPYRSTMKRACQESTRIVLASWLSSLLAERKAKQLGS